MATFSFEGLDKYQQEMEKLANKTDAIVNSALYEGTKVVADSIQKETDNIPTYYRAKGPKKIPVTGLTVQQKQGLKDGLGVARFWHDTKGTFTKIGYDGYNSQRTKKYPKGQPNALIARSIIRGTSYLLKYDYIKKALAASKANAVTAMDKEIGERIKIYTDLSNK